MLKQCDDGQRDFVDGSVEVEVEGAIGGPLQSIVELKERLQWCNNQIRVDSIIITYQTPWYLPLEHPIVVKMEDEMIYHSHGLPLAATTFNTIMQNQTCGGE
ncbi:hypothetical protein CK203_115979 [Vitis vinifera]|uniref:Uncharacterized protein n=1 Tax=Vitis vinifera TaxID=29760 RepID=A0A438CC12_VITVI|nr:hypothetical protein CK203_115979 [Vitis vinifera]